MGSKGAYIIRVRGVGEGGMGALGRGRGIEEQRTEEREQSRRWKGC